MWKYEASLEQITVFDLMYEEIMELISFQLKEVNI